MAVDAALAWQVLVLQHLHDQVLHVPKHDPVGLRDEVRWALHVILHIFQVLMAALAEQIVVQHSIYQPHFIFLVLLFPNML